MGEDHVQQIKDRLDIVEVISGYVRLTKSGANYKGVCPFHQEKTPSFMVSEEKQIWHCFGCSEGGDIFSFVQKIEGMSFPESLQLLADRAGVQLPKYQGGGGQNSQETSDRKTRLFDVLEEAGRFFQQQLAQDSGKTAKEYLLKRGLEEKIISSYRIGYVRDEWHSLDDYLQNKGFTREEMKDVGLLVSREDGKTYDRFRDRVIFPIFDIQGRIVGFGGRTLSSSEDAGAKYINTPQTDIYNKSKVLYGIHTAKLDIRKNDYVVIVEGYMDVLMSHQVGVRNVVAVSGTALTNDHLKILGRYTKNIMLAFDMDVAGERAAKRSVAMALGQDWNMKVVQLGAGKDAADAIVEDPSVWIDALKNAQPVIDYYIAIALEKHNVVDVMGKKKIAAEVFDALRYVQDPLETSHYIQRLSSILSVPEDVLRETLTKFHSTSGGASRQYIKNDRGNERTEKVPTRNRRADLEEQCVGLMIGDYSDLRDFPVSMRYFRDEQWREVFQKLLQYDGEWNQELFVKQFSHELQNLLNIAIMKAEKTVSESEILPNIEFERSYRELSRLYFDEELRRVQELLRQAEERNDNDGVAQYTSELHQLFEQLRSLS